MVSDPAQMPFVLENAIRAAVGQGGVAVIVIPGDVGPAGRAEARPGAARRD